MADRRTARPVSGEIMTGAAAMPRGPRTAPMHNAFVDADYEVLPAAGTLSVYNADLDQHADRIDGMGMLRATPDTGARQGLLARGGPLFWSCGAVLVLAAFWISGGHQIVGAWRDDAPDVAPHVLVISDVASRVDASGSKPLLFVDGQAGNSGATVAVMPELEIRVTGKDGRVTRYNLGTAGRTMGPGEKFAFSSRLDLPKNGVETVSVSFAE